MEETGRETRKGDLPEDASALYRKAFMNFLFFAALNKSLSYAFTWTCESASRFSEGTAAKLVNWTVSLVHALRSSHHSIASLVEDPSLLSFDERHTVDYAIKGFREVSLPWSLGYFLWDAIDMPLSGAGFSVTNLMHHAVASAGAVFVMATKKCSIYAFSAIFAELNSVFLALRAISHLNRSKSGKFYRFFVFPNLLLTFVYTRIFIHGLALRQSYRLITKDLPKRKKGEEKKGGVILSSKVVPSHP